VRQKSVRTTRELADALRSSESRTLLLERVALVQEEPVALFASYLSPKRFPGLGDRVAERGSLSRVLEDDYHVVPVRADTIVEVGRCTTAQSALLLVPAGSALLIARGTSFDEKDEAIEHFHVHYRADRIRLRLDSYRFAEQVVPDKRRGEQA
jgi:GntR family transcriptional regulator